MPSRSYRASVGKRGASNLTASTNVAFTVSTTGGSTAFLAGLSRWGGQEIRPTDGKTISRAWTVTFGESQAAEEITPRLMDGGRAAILRRLLDLSARPSTDTTWTSTHIEATGRITDVQMSDSVGAYEFTIQDERIVEREATIFTDAVVDPGDPDPTDTSEVSITRGSTTTSLYPAGLTSRWGRLPETPTATYRVTGASTGNLAALRRTLDNDAKIRPALTREGEQLILDDLYSQRRGFTRDSVPRDATDTSSTRGDFRTLVAEVDGTNRPLRANDFILDGQVHKWVRGGEQVDARVPNGFFVVWASSERPAAGTNVQVRLIAPTHEPTRALPKHIASGSTDAPGQHMVQIAQDIWDELDVRYSSTQLTALKNRRESHRGSFIIERADQNAARWMQERLWTHSLLAPVVDRQGRVSPKSVALPTGEDISDVSNVQTAGSSNLSKHPTWSHPSNEMVNVLKIKSRPFRTGGQEGRSSLPDGFAEFVDEVPGIGVTAEVGGFETFTRRHDTGSTGDARFLGERELEVTLPSFASGADADFVARQFFTRYGDGPIRTETDGLSELEGLDPGDFLVIDVPTYPNLGTSGRGGKRLVQITGRMGSLSGPRYQVVDTGTTANPLSAPTISVSRNSGLPKHALDADVGTTSGYVLQVAESTSTPGTGSSAWQTAGGNDTGSTYTIPDLPSGAKHFVRAQAKQPGRIGSTWTSPASTTTESLAAPSSVSSSGIIACGVDLSVVLAETDYPVEILRDSTSQGVIGPASSGTTLLFEDRGLSAGSTYVYNARHIDGFGGVSAGTSHSVTTSTASVSASAVEFTFAAAEGTT